MKSVVILCLFVFGVWLGHVQSVSVIGEILKAKDRSGCCLPAAFQANLTLFTNSAGRQSSPTWLIHFQTDQKIPVTRIDYYFWYNQSTEATHVTLWDIYKNDRMYVYHWASNSCQISSPPEWTGPWCVNQEDDYTFISEQSILLQDCEKWRIQDWNGTSDMILLNNEGTCTPGKTI
eukprot:TRINITY_DN7253_c0_g1_i1.p1 TRINITY_DN7253_c0_g1~~TRINITY_DN7253_c0_g1_i1.p1  ORF type:complete len:176 (-),score=18.64 TRINITY_DN7253_c0_g1_i1:246-773(-)